MVTYARLCSEFSYCSSIRGADVLWSLFVMQCGSTRMLKYVRRVFLPEADLMPTFSFHLVPFSVNVRKFIADEYFSATIGTAKVLEIREAVELSVPLHLLSLPCAAPISLDQRLNFLRGPGWRMSDELFFNLSLQTHAYKFLTTITIPRPLFLPIAVRLGAELKNKSLCIKEPCAPTLEQNIQVHAGPHATVIHFHIIDKRKTFLNTSKYTPQDLNQEISVALVILSTPITRNSF